MNRPGGRAPTATTARLTAHIKKEAAASGQPFERVQRRFVMGRFLARVFAADPDGWVLKGGVGMMLRLPQARYSRDVDMSRLPRAEGAVDDVAALAQLVRAHPIDPFDFDVQRGAPLSGGKGFRVLVIVRLGIREFARFTIDLATWTGVVGAIEDHELAQVPDLDEFPVPARIRLYPLADQIADKLCAMYEKRSTTGGEVVASTRYRDLVDLLLICEHLRFELAETVEAVDTERIRRGVELPSSLSAPGPQWVVQWRAVAADSPLPAGLHTLETALAAAEHCFGRVLASLPRRAPVDGFWNPVRAQWD